MVKQEQDYRSEVPEGRVVDKLEQWVKSRGYVPIEVSAQMYQEVLKELNNLEEIRKKRIDLAQELFDRRFGEKKENVAENKEDSELAQFYANL